MATELMMNKMMAFAIPAMDDIIRIGVADTTDSFFKKSIKFKIQTPVWTGPSLKIGF